MLRFLAACCCGVNYAAARELMKTKTRCCVFLRCTRFVIASELRPSIFVQHSSLPHKESPGNIKALTLSKLIFVPFTVQTVSHVLA
jgi:hypothetical protein